MNEGLSVLFFNVEGLSTEKLILISKWEDPDIICLAETWRHDNDFEFLTLNGYSAFFKNRIYKHHKARRSSGGIAVYFRNYLKLEICACSSEDLLWVKFPKAVSGHTTDIFLCVAYIPPAQSPRHHEVSRDIFQSLSEDIHNFMDQGEIILIGDFNSRTGMFSKYVFEPNTIFEPFLPVYEISADEYTNIPDRRTSDHVLDGFGQRLVQICTAAKLIILNGRLGSDLLEASWTCVKKSKEGAIVGGSIVDYAICSSTLFKKMVNFLVMKDVAEDMSRHSPLLVTMNFGATYGQDTVMEQRFEACTKKFHWNDAHEALFQQRLTSPESSAKIREIAEIVTKANPVRDNIQEALTLFYNVIENAAGKEMVSNKRNSYNEKQAAWWNKECQNDLEMYLDARHGYSGFKSRYTAQTMKRYRNKFRNTVRKARGAYKRNLSLKITRSESRDPKTFWRLFKGTLPRSVCGPTPSEFFDHYSNLFSEPFVSNESDTWSEYVRVYTRGVSLNSVQNLGYIQPITISEMNKAAQKLKNGKSAGPDLLTNEFIKHAIGSTGEHLLLVFNEILRHAIYPEVWAKATIVSLHKAGDPKAVTNYRGISLISSLAKLFDTIIIERIQTWAHTENLVDDCQFAYKKNNSTVDAVFTLMCLVEKRKAEGGKVFCAMVDFSKAFDKICREAMLYKLALRNAPASFILLVKDMYDKMVSTVRDLPEKIFHTNTGVQQGHVFSPFLFNAFTNDLKTDLENGGGGSVLCGNRAVSLIMYADDMALVAEDENGLKKSLEILEMFCNRWGLTVNTGKTKVIVFQSPSRFQNQDVYHFNYDNVPLEIVQSFKYLGLTLARSGITGSTTIKARICHADKAMFALTARLRSLELSIETSFRMFDTLVVPCLLYGVELFAHLVSDDIEVVQHDFIRSVLQVRQSTPKIALLGETGRYPLGLVCKIRLVKYWAKIVNLPDYSLPKVAYSVYMNLFRQGRVVKWLNVVQRTLSDTNQGLIWRSQKVENPRKLIRTVKEQLIQQYRNMWHGLASTFTSLDTYVLYKVEHKLEEYFSVIKNKRHLVNYVRFRLHAHSLEIERGRYVRVAREQRICKCCVSQEVEDECHFLLSCTAFDHLRQNYIPQNVRNAPATIENYSKLMAITDPVTVIGIAKYLFFATKVRKNIVGY